MNFVEQRFADACRGRMSDDSNAIQDHLPFLRDLAKKCKHVTEFGVHFGNSSSAFMLSGAVLRSYDITPTSQAQQLFAEAAKLGIDATYTIASSMEVDINKTDLLFIDTHHTYKQITIELNRHWTKAGRFIVMHDTHAYAVRDDDGGPGIIPAVLEFLSKHHEWRVYSHDWRCNGLTVLERVG
jgi:cephalosporin hydroxylase